MAEKTESNSGTAGSSAGDRLISRRKAIIGGGMALLAAGVNAALPKAAQADSIIPTAPPDFISENPANSNQPSSVPNLEAGSRSFNPDKKDQAVVTVIDRKVKTAENFLNPSSEGDRPNVSINFSRHPKNTSIAITTQPENSKKPDVKNPSLSVDISASVDKPASVLALEAGAELSLLIIESNNKKDLITNFALGFGKFADVNIYALQNGKSTEEQMAFISNAAHFLDFPNYTGSPPKGNIFTERDNLTETFLIKCFSIWMSESDQLAQKLNQAPANLKTPMAEIFLFGLKLLSECGNNPAAFKSLGIKEKTLAEILKLSDKPEFADYFKRAYK